MVIGVPTQAPAANASPSAAGPGAVAVGARVQVAGTGANMLRIRQAPGTDTVTLKFVSDGTNLVVLAGPEQASGLTWWKVDDQAGTVGWAAEQFLQPAP